ncbi:MAG TPA: hypothetical protein VFO66_00695, partial [Gemmatimonadaceae bacterium]|nr:hypothetical protein [Gemmatimonadaceae bacterium]
MTSRAHDRITPAPEHAGDDRRVARLLSALAEAPDYGSAANFLLNELSQLAGGAPAAILRYLPASDSLAFIDAAGVAPGDRREFPDTIEDRDHPLLIAALSLTPVVREADRVARVGRVGPIHAWTALPLPQPHYRGAPVLIRDNEVAARLEQSGARAVPLRERGFNTAPAGVVLLGVVLDDDRVESFAELTMMAGSILARLASFEWWRDQGERLQRERDRLTLMVDSL